MRKRKPVEDYKKSGIYPLLFFFVSAFTIKIIFGTLTASNALLVSGTFELFGIFLSIVILLRNHFTSDPSHQTQKNFNPRKLELIIAAGISALIVISTIAFLFTIVHAVLFHKLCPPDMLAVWIAIALAVFNLIAAYHLKKNTSNFQETDENQLRFLFEKDYVISILVALVVIVSQIGFVTLDPIVAILEALFVLGYSIFFLAQSSKGLMDASPAAADVAKISECIKKSDPSLRIQSLKVNLLGRNFEIVTTVSFSSAATVNEAKIVIWKIEHALKAGLSIPFKVYVGIADHGTNQPETFQKTPEDPGLCQGASDCRKCSESVLKWSIFLNFFIGFLKIIGAVLSKSMGLLADCAESFGCIIATCAIAYSIKISKKDKDVKFPFGYGKLEFIVALAVHSILFGMGLFITVSSLIMMFTQRESTPNIIGLPFVLLVILISFIIYRFSLCAGRKLNSPGLIANAYNSRADLLTTVGVTLGIILSQLGSNFIIFDVLAALLVGLFIAKESVEHWLLNVLLVLDKVPEPDYSNKIKAVVSEVFAGTIHVLKPKRTGQNFWLGVGLEMPENAALNDLKTIQKKIRKHLLEKINWIEEIDFFLKPASV